MSGDSRLETEALVPWKPVFALQDINGLYEAWTCDRGDLLYLKSTGRSC